MKKRPIRMRALLSIGVAALLFNACGSNSENSASDQPSKPIELPETLVRDLGTDKDVTVASLIPADRPILLWFWAPH